MTIQEAKDELFDKYSHLWPQIHGKSVRDGKIRIYGSSKPSGFPANYQGFEVEFITDQVPVQQ
jgi:hypothetical protein